MSYLTDIMKKRKNIQFFKEEAPDKKVIDDILREAHDLIPHKNNFWHYKIRVYGPEPVSYTHLTLPTILLV